MSFEQSSNQTDSPRVLVVDDEAALSELVELALKYEGFTSRTAVTGLEALAAVRDYQPDLIILDVMIPSPDGFGVLEKLRAEGNETPVIFLTAKGEVTDRVKGLRSGGDDYITKPFSIEELMARVIAHTRRHAKQRENSVLTVGDLTIDDAAHEVRRSNDLIALTATEYEVLHYLAANAKRVLSKAQILDQVWDYDFGGQDNNVELYISYLRKKIDRGRPPMIHTVRGVGYVLKPSGS